MATTGFYGFRQKDRLALSFINASAEPDERGVGLAHEWMDARKAHLLTPRFFEALRIVSGLEIADPTFLDIVRNVSPNKEIQRQIDRQQAGNETAFGHYFANFETGFSIAVATGTITDHAVWLGDITLVNWVYIANLDDDCLDIYAGPALTAHEDGLLSALPATSTGLFGARHLARLRPEDVADDEEWPRKLMELHYLLQGDRTLKMSGHERLMLHGWRARHAPERISRHAAEKILRRNNIAPVAQLDESA